MHKADRDQIRRYDGYETPLGHRWKTTIVGVGNEAMVDVMVGCDHHLEDVEVAINQDKRVQRLLVGPQRHVENIGLNRPQSIICIFECSGWPYGNRELQSILTICLQQGVT